MSPVYAPILFIYYLWKKGLTLTMILSNEMKQTSWDGFFKFVRFDVGNGSRICFQHNIQNGDTMLKEKDPELFLIARDRCQSGRFSAMDNLIGP